MTFTMRDVIQNQQLIGMFHADHDHNWAQWQYLTHSFNLGSTMGSHKDLTDATQFIAKHRIVPTVSTVLEGLEAAEEGFELIRRGEQFGKVVIRMNHDTASAQYPTVKL